MSPYSAMILSMQQNTQHSLLIPIKMNTPQGFPLSVVLQITEVEDESHSSTLFVICSLYKLNKTHLQTKHLLAHCSTDALQGKNLSKTLSENHKK